VIASQLTGRQWHASPMSYPAGWYNDPQDPASQRYWDGGFWTDHRRPAQAPPYLAQGQSFGYWPLVPSTPDGVALSGWGKRVGARILDGLIVAIGSLPLTGYFIVKEVEALIAFERRTFDDALAGKTTFNTVLPWDVYRWVIPATIIGMMVSFAYEYLFLTHSGATLGKKALGISVRLRDVAGPPPGLAVAKRFGVYIGPSLLGAVPFIGSLFSLLGLLNDLWPLWDDKKQALHDKVAATNVVVGPQPRRSAI
jgi:uncharacterized RDD family membrane protein YckC